MLSRNSHVISFESLVKDYLDKESIPYQAFYSGVLKSLEAGAIDIIVAGDRILPNVILLSNSIQGNAGLSFTIKLVELAVFKLGDDVLVMPNLVGKTVERFLRNEIIPSASSLLSAMTH